MDQGRCGQNKLRTQTDRSTNNKILTYNNKNHETTTKRDEVVAYQ